MAIDESFVRPGAVPFKWEIRPGTPKVRHHHHSSPNSKPPQKLKPPPSGIYFYPPPEFTTRSFQPTSRPRSERRRFHQPTTVRSTSVSSCCFPSSRRTWKDDKKSNIIKVDPEPDYASNLETLARWSLSSRKSISPFHTSLSSSFSSSCPSSPRPVVDAEWAAFGLF